MPVVKPLPTLCRLEKLNPHGEWVIIEAGVALLYPQRYAERLAERGTFGRATELDDRLQPTGTVWGPETEPSACPLCDEYHAAPYDGSCLI